MNDVLDRSVARVHENVEFYELMAASFEPLCNRSRYLEDVAIASGIEVRHLARGVNPRPQNNIAYQKIVGQGEQDGGMRQPFFADRSRQWRTHSSLGQIEPGFNQSKHGSGRERRFGSRWPCLWDRGRFPGLGGTYMSGCTGLRRGLVHPRDADCALSVDGHTKAAVVCWVRLHRNRLALVHGPFERHRHRSAL